MGVMTKRVVVVSAAMLGTAAVAAAGDWSNNGGNAGRNGQTYELGPDAATTLWSGGASSLIAWQPVIEGNRVFVVRQSGFPPETNSDKSPVIAYDLNTGAELWRKNIPYLTNDWTTWIAGARDGHVYAGRSGNGASVQAKLYALDSSTGNVVWTSVDKVDAGPYDGVVFAPNGDLIVASFTKIWRIRATDGTTAWTASRVGSVSGTCGGAATDTAVYVADAVPGGHAIKKFDIATGAFLYQSSVLAGFTIQNTPMVSPDGTIYLSRVQNSASVDYFFAIEDTGSAMNVRWSTPAQWTTNSEFAVAPDGGVFMVAPGKFLQKRRSSDGAVVANYEIAIVSDSPLAPRMAVDRRGWLYMSNGGFANGKLFAFDPNLALQWSVNVTNINIGGPAIGSKGTLVVAGNGTQLKAYRTVRCPSDFDGSGFVDFDDFNSFVAAFEAGSPAADFDGSGFVDFDDFNAFVQAFELGC